MDTLKNRAVLTAYGMQRLRSRFGGTADAVASRGLKRDINSIVPGIRHVDVDVSL